MEEDKGGIVLLTWGGLLFGRCSLGGWDGAGDVGGGKWKGEGGGGVEERKEGWRSSPRTTSRTASNSTCFRRDSEHATRSGRSPHPTRPQPDSPPDAHPSGHPRPQTQLVSIIIIHSGSQHAHEVFIDVIVNQRCFFREGDSCQDFQCLCWIRRLELEKGCAPRLP